MEKGWFGTAPRSPVVPFYPFTGEGSPTKIDYRKKGTLILTSLLAHDGGKGQGEALGTQC